MTPEIDATRSAREKMYYSVGIVGIIETQFTHGCTVSYRMDVLLSKNIFGAVHWVAETTLTRL